MSVFLRDVWSELKNLVQDEGVFLFCLLMPAVYPLLYAWIYNNEVIREVPVAVVDNSHSSFSREFIRMADAAPDVRIAAYANSLAEAQQMVEKQQVRGIYLFPEDMADAIYDNRRAYVSVYADMAITLYYKAIYQTAAAVSGRMNKNIRISKMAKLTTARDEDVAAAPLNFYEVPIFNPTSGYGNFILPAVLMLVLQQTLLLGIGLSAGTRRERRKAEGIEHMHSGQSLLSPYIAYFMIYALWAAYLSMGVPHIFGLVMMAQWQDLLPLMTIYLLAAISFGFALSWLVREREHVLLLVVFTSVPFLFLSGVSWPLENIPGFWRGVAALIPSTFAVRAYVKLASMGASFVDVLPEFLWLVAQFIVYSLLALLVRKLERR